MNLNQQTRCRGFQLTGKQSVHERSGQVELQMDLPIHMAYPSISSQEQLPKDGEAMSIQRTALRALTTALILMSGACVAPPPNANSSASQHRRAALNGRDFLPTRNL